MQNEVRILCIRFFTNVFYNLKVIRTSEWRCWRLDRNLCRILYLQTNPNCRRPRNTETPLQTGWCDVKSSAASCSSWCHNDSSDVIFISTDARRQLGYYSQRHQTSMLLAEYFDGPVADPVGRVQYPDIWISSRSGVLVTNSRPTFRSGLRLA